MSIKHRVEKLEQRQPASTLQKYELIGVLDGETEAQAIERWKAEHPDKTEPDNIIFLVPFGDERGETA
ncbi:MAG: hypothetical protein ACR65R_11415 [Methylomicrobium sp.]